MAAHDIGIDLGTRNSRVFSTGKGIVLSEPSVVVYDRNTERIRAIGEEALQMMGRLNSNMEIIWPVRHGVIVDYVVFEKMLKYFIGRAMGRRTFRKPRMTLCLPSGVTEIEKKAIEEAAYQSGARHVYLAKNPVAAALGAGIDIMKPFGNMIVDIGAGTTEAAVVSVGGIVVSSSLKVGGGNFNQAIMAYARKHHSLFVSDTIAEDIKRKIGSAMLRGEDLTWEVKGRNVITGLPKTTVLSTSEICSAIRECTSQIVDTIHGVLEKTPPELAADIVKRGILLTGGGALLKDMDTLIEEKTGVHTLTVQDAMTCMVIGSGKYADVMSKNE